LEPWLYHDVTSTKSGRSLGLVTSHAAGGGEQMKRRSWHEPWTQAPQSQLLSEVHARRSQLCGDVEPALQSVLGGHLKAPPTQETGEQPFTSAPALAEHAVPAGHLYPSVEQLATAQPLTSAPARVGAQVSPLAHAKSGPHIFGLQRPLAVSQLSEVAQEVAVQRAMHIVPGPPAKLQPHGFDAGTQTWSAPQPASPEHWPSGGMHAPQPPA
jgi:hypothetical protein